MGNIYSSFTTTLQTPGKQIDSKLLGGNARLYPFSFIFDSNAGATPLLYMTKVQAGTRLFGIVSQFTAGSASAGAGLNLDIGDADDTDRLYNDLDMDAAGTLVVPLRITTGFSYLYTADTWITGTVTAGTPDAAASFIGYFVGTAE